jgi:hypothetical protein
MVVNLVGKARSNVGTPDATVTTNAPAIAKKSNKKDDDFSGPGRWVIPDDLAAVNKG